MFRNKPFIVAELGANHMGDYRRMVEMIDAAKAAGADAVKFQTYTPEEMTLPGIVIPSGPWAGVQYHNLYSAGSTPRIWHDTLFSHARGLGLTPFSTPFSPDAVDFLETLDCPIYKIASPELTYLPLIAAAARTGKPLIISTGMGNMSEILTAYRVAMDNGAASVTFLHCLSAYPADPVDFHLNTIRCLQSEGFDVGLSDHSLGYVADVVATALGVTVIEKHFTLCRADGGLDSKFSLEPQEFREMVWACRMAHASLGTAKLGVRPSEADSVQYRRSIWITKDVKKGEILTPANMAILRPNYGLPPEDWNNIISKPVNKDLKAGTPMRLDYV